MGYVLIAEAAALLASPAMLVGICGMILDRVTLRRTDARIAAAGWQAMGWAKKVQPAAK